MLDRTDTPSPLRARWRSSAALAALLAAALVLGCAQTPPPAGDPDPDPEPQPTVLRGNAVWSSAAVDPDPLIAVSLWMLDLQIPGEKLPDKAAASRSGTRLDRLSVAPDALRASSVVEIDGGFYLAGVGQVGADGAFELVLPDGDAIPEALFRPAEASIPVQSYAGGECSLVASDPESQVTFTIFEGVTLSSPIFLTPEGLAFGITATEATDFVNETDLATITFVSLVYATAPTTLTQTGAGCAPETGLSVLVDVTLEEGWNQLTWDYLANDSLTIGDRPMSEPVFSVVVGTAADL